MSKERRYIIIAGAILLLIGAVYRFYPDVRQFFSFQNEFALKRKNLIKYQQMVKEKNALEAALSAMEGQLQTAEAGLLSGETAAIAAVEIQNTLNEIAEENNVEIRSMQVMKPEGQKDEPYVSVPVQISIQTNTRGLKNVLYGIEASPKTFHITNLRVRTSGRTESDRIEAAFTVTGYMKRL